MRGFGIEKLALVLLVVMVLFGARRLPEIGASLGKGIRSFKKGVAGNDEPPSSEPAPEKRDLPALPRPRHDEARLAEPKRLIG
jgi:sec-independent protein translocase protein TatA